MEEAITNGDPTGVKGELVDTMSVQLCLRHISSIQIRNLSPFPARDSLASALVQKPAALPSGAKNGSGLASDDGDILLGRRRRRRISSASMRSVKSIHSDEEHDSLSLHESTLGASHARKRTNSRASLYAVGNSSSSPVTKRQYHMSPADIRQRQRKASEASLPEDSLPSAFTSSSAWFSDTVNSQRQLEDVIWPRLLETFLTISVPQDDGSLPISSSPDHFCSIAQTQGDKDGPPKRNSGSADLQQFGSTSASGTSRHARRTNSISSATRDKFHTNTTSVSSSTTTNDTVAIWSASSPHKAAFPQSPPLTPPPAGTPTTPFLPFFISPIHWPSTNPKFELDPDDFSRRSTGLSIDTVFIRLWGRVGTGSCRRTVNAVRSKGKGKERRGRDSHDGQSGEWEVLSEWDVGFPDLVPLPDDLIEHPWKLPANTLVLTLSPLNRAYYLPSTLLGVTPAPSRPGSPSYNSDTEVSRRRPSIKTIFPERGRRGKSRRELKSANLNELVKLVSLQASLIDAQNLLHGVVETCNRLVEGDSVIALRRESSEREYHLRWLQEQRDLLDDDMKLIREGTALRKEQLRQRRMRLADARALHEDDLLTEFDAGTQVAEERKWDVALKNRIEPVRTSLLSTVAFIFPIELLSPPDLLYTIVGVPLPIPLQGNDPAPPLSLLQVPSVNEDGVATALGYAALLVHLMASYLCQRLVYPITYVGSRSLVKDPISAMMGPRMFPLYSKGVDTYRFEYAVFLLNKDIEMLMADRNLRALDLRHTLPNLKNLLLTLTSGESTLPSSRPLCSPSVVTITPGLQSPSLYAVEATKSGDSEPPPLTFEGDDVGSSTTPKGQSVKLPSVDEGEDSRSIADDSNKDANGGVTLSSAASENSDEVSTSSEDRTGTSSAASTLRPRLPRIQIQSYLGLAPLSSMWRGRGVSSSSEASSSENTGPRNEDAQEESLGASFPEGDIVNGTSEDTSDSSEDADEDEDDRRTVRGFSAPTTPVGDTRSRRGNVVPENLLDNFKDLKARVNLRGGSATTVDSETEKCPESVEDRDTVIDTAC